MTLIYLVAGEASGDVLGGRLMAALLARRPDLRFAGIGGPQMQAHGFSSLFPMHDLALMGFLEVLPQLLRLRARLNQVVADIASRRPDAVVTIDSPGFTLRLLRRIRPLGIPRAHYVAPQVWAWRESRVRDYPGLWDRLLCLLPFEPAFFVRHNLPASFVGHPVMESGTDRGDGPGFRARHGIASDARILILMPGSRSAEVARLLPIYGETLRRLAGQVPDLRPVVIAAPAMAGAVAAAVGAWTGQPVVASAAEDKRDAFAAAAAALTKSGTSTLELALAGVPMAVAYRINPFSAAIARRLIKVRHASLLNLLAGTEVVPEFLQQDCTPERLAGTLGTLLTDGAAARAQRGAFPPLLARLRPSFGLPSEAAAGEVLALLDEA